MANDERERRPRPSSEERRRQYILDRITAQYADEYHAGLSPRLEDYVQRYPEYADELTDFVLYFHAVSLNLPEPDVVPAQVLSPAAEAALARIRGSVAASGAAPIESLVKQGRTQGYNARQLAVAVGLSSDLLGKLDAKVIAANSIPRTLISRLAQTLATAPEAVAAYLGLSAPAGAGQFYYAEQAPTQRQESFMDAVTASTLDDAAKREWNEVVARERQGT